MEVVVVEIIDCEVTEEDVAFYDLLRKGYDWCRLVGGGYLGPQSSDRLSRAEGK